MKALKGDTNEIKLHLGGGDKYLNDWINIDKFSNHNANKLDLVWNLKKPLPFRKDSVDVIYDEGFLERLVSGPASVELFLGAFRHILKPEGLLKIALPDMRHKEKLEPWFKKLGFSNLEFCGTECATNEEVIIENIIAIDNSLVPFGFRTMEINGLMEGIDNFSSYTMSSTMSRPEAWFKYQFGVSEALFNENKKEYLKYYPQNENGLKYLYPYKKYNFNLAYCSFLSLAHTLLPFYEKNKIPFVFTLYPGGTFGLNNEGSDAMLREVFESKYFRKVIVTQKATLDYLLTNNLCPLNKIEYIFGGYVQFKKEEILPKNYYPANKSTIDICFIADKYLPEGVDKGYDLFIETAKKIAPKYPDIRFHVVGGFDETDIDVTDIKDVITFYGYKTPEFLKDFYSRMDICLSPNKPFKLYKGNFDGFPLGIDALACQTALFTTDELNNNDGYFNEDEIVIIKPELNDVVEKVEFYLNNLSLLYKISEKGQKKLYKILDPNNRIEKVKEILLKESKPVLSKIEFHVTEHCNLNCKGCGHCCPIAEPEFANLEKVKRDLKRLSELFSNITRINILGGEPLLHKDINEFMKITREFFPNSTIYLVTNGILIPKMPEAFWHALNNFSIKLYISLYPPFESLYEKIFQLAKKYNVDLEHIKVTKFIKSLDLSGSNHKTETFNKCEYKICNFVKNGTISACGIPHHVGHFNKKFNKMIPQDGILDIHDPTITGQKIIEFLNTPVETCKYCKPGFSSFDWSTSEGKESEWCIDNTSLENDNTKTKLHIGCGTNYFDGWVNIDNNSDNNITKLDLNWDLRNPLPFKDNSVDFIYNEHFLEHLSVEEGLKSLRDFKRVLKPDGILRIAMPDLADVIKLYKNENWKKDNAEFFTKFGLNFIQTRAEYVNIALRRWGHQWVYDWEELERRLKEVGFKNIKQCKLRQSENIELSGLETRNESTLIAEVSKTANMVSSPYGKNPILTIVLLTYNHKNYIKRALDSIFMQKTNFNFKIIIADDCSTDGTTEICREYTDKHPEIVEFTPKIRNLGMIDNIYEQYFKIKTPYFTILEGDDYWTDPDKLQTQIDLLEKNPDCVICGHNTIYSYPDKDSKLIGELLPDCPDKFSLNDNRYLHSSSRVYRNIIDFNDYPKEQVTLEIYLYHIMLDKGYCIYHDKIMSVYNNQNPNSVYAHLSKTEKIKSYNDVAFNMLNLLDFKYEDYYIKNWLYNPEKYFELSNISNKKARLQMHYDLVNSELKNRIEERKIKVKVGCENNYFDGWINIDINFDNNIKKLDLNWDFEKSLPFDENSLDSIYVENPLANLTQEERIKILRKFRYLLSSGGILKIALPDLSENDYWLNLKRNLKEAGFKDIKKYESAGTKTLKSNTSFIAEAHGELPILTVFVLTYNQKYYIRRSLDSILMQKTDFKFKLVISDDCSTDGTIEICREYAEKYPDIIEFISRTKNQGADNNYFECYSSVKTPYFMGLDGDDYWIDPNKLQIQINLLEGNQDCIMCAHNTTYKYPDKEVALIGEFLPGPLPGKFDLDDCKYLHTSSRMYRNVFDFNKYPRELMSKDLPMYNIMLDAGKCVYYDKVMSVYDCSNPDSLWAAASTLKQGRESNELAIKMLNYFNFKHEEYYIENYLAYQKLYTHLIQKYGREDGLKIYEDISAQKFHYAQEKEKIKGEKSKK